MDYYTRMINKFDNTVLPAWEANDELAKLRKENGDLRLMVAVLKQVILEHKEIFQKIAEKNYETQP